VSSHFYFTDGTEPVPPIEMKTGSCGAWSVDRPRTLSGAMLINMRLRRLL